MKLFKLVDEPTNILFVLQNSKWVQFAAEEEIDDYISSLGLIFVDYEYEQREPWPEVTVQYYVSGVVEMTDCDQCAAINGGCTADKGSGSCWDETPVIDYSQEY